MPFEYCPRKGYEKNVLFIWPADFGMVFLLAMACTEMHRISADQVKRAKDCPNNRLGRNYELEKSKAMDIDEKLERKLGSIAFVELLTAVI